MNKESLYPPEPTQQKVWELVTKAEELFMPEGPRQIWTNTKQRPSQSSIAIGESNSRNFAIQPYDDTGSPTPGFVLARKEVVLSMMTFGTQAKPEERKIITTKEFPSRIVHYFLQKTGTSGLVIQPYETVDGHHHASYPTVLHFDEIQRIADFLLTTQKQSNQP